MLLFGNWSGRNVHLINASVDLSLIVTAKHKYHVWITSPLFGLWHVLLFFHPHEKLTELRGYLSILPINAQQFCGVVKRCRYYGATWNLGHKRDPAVGGKDYTLWAFEDNT